MVYLSIFLFKILSILYIFKNMPNVTVKWSGKEYEIEVKDDMTVSSFKDSIEAHTGVKPERQKILNLKHMGRYNHENIM